MGRFEKLFLKIVTKIIHVGVVGKLDQQNYWTNRIQTWNINKMLRIQLFEEGKL